MLALEWGGWASGALVITALHAGLLVPRLPEPTDGAPLGKLPYRALPTARRMIPLLVLAAAAQLFTLHQPAPERPIWLVFGSAVAALVWVDLHTTWLPRTLTLVVAVELAAALGIGLCWAADPVALCFGGLLGAAGGAAVFGLAWLIARGRLGFGDVRLATLTGLMGGTMSLSGWYTALLGAALVGVAWGLACRGRWIAPGTTSGFAYGPALFAGPYLAGIWAMVG